MPDISIGEFFVRFFSSVIENPISIQGGAIVALFIFSVGIIKSGIRKVRRYSYIIGTNVVYFGIEYLKAKGYF